jgi:hypothetical protein
VRPVEQLVQVYGLGAGNYVKAIRYNGAAVAGEVVALQSGAMTHKLTIVVDDKPGTITGAVVSDGNPVSRPVIFGLKWPPHYESISGMARAKGDETGQFQIAGLVPGEYHLIALRSVDAAMDAVALKRALEAAKKIEVGPGNSVNVTLDVTELK